MLRRGSSNKTPITLFYFRCKKKMFTNQVQDSFFVIKRSTSALFTYELVVNKSQLMVYKRFYFIIIYFSFVGLFTGESEITKGLSQVRLGPVSSCCSCKMHKMAGIENAGCMRIVSKQTAASLQRNTQRSFTNVLQQCTHIYDFCIMLEEEEKCRAASKVLS